MRIGYIASSIYRHTFEINEVVELLRQLPSTRVYSFHRAPSKDYQSARLNEIKAEIQAPKLTSAVVGLTYLVRHVPFRLVTVFFKLLILSSSNPVYWLKNTAVFFAAMPILADAHRNGITHLHANFGSSPATVAWLGKQLLGVPFSVTYHAFDIYATNALHRDPLKRRKLIDSRRVIAVHAHGLAYLRELVPGADSAKFRVIRICVAFSSDQRAANPGAPLLVAAGNLVPKKGFEILVEAVAILLHKGIGVRARILGEGPQRSQLESMIDKLSLGNSVVLGGYYQHSELAGHLAEATALVVPSKVVSSGQRDGIPTVIVEAWLARTPVIASIVGGMADVVTDGLTALVFPSGDASTLASCIEQLFDSPELRSRITDNGHECAHKQFSPRANVGSLIEFIARDEPVPPS